MTTTPTNNWPVNPISTDSDLKTKISTSFSEESSVISRFFCKGVDMVSGWAISMLLTDFSSEIIDECAYPNNEVSTLVNWHLTFVLISLTI